MSETDKKKIVRAMQSENFEKELESEGFNVYTTESKGKKKIKDQI